MKILSIKSEETYDWLLRVHYAKRIPPISYCFGLFVENELVGVVTYGVPSSSTLRDGIAGKENSDKVLELNRLVFSKPIKNGPSKLVSSSLALLPKPSIVVSYADTEQGHIGYVYQACNFIYTGLSAKRTDWKVKGLEHLHGQTIADMSKAAIGTDKSRVQFMREKFGDNFYLKDRAQKHRYIYVCAKNPEKTRIEQQIKYKTQPYPKGNSQKYDITYNPQSQILLFA